MTTIAVLVSSFTSKTNITTILRNYVDDFNKRRPSLDATLDHFKASFYAEMRKETAREPPNKATIPRSSFEEILVALPAVSAEVRNSDIIINNRYRVADYTSLPQLSSCLFLSRSLVVPEDAIFDVLYLLWCFTQHNLSRIRCLVDNMCAHVPARLVFCFLRVAKRTAPTTLLSIPPAEPMSVSSFGPNARCSYLASSVSSDILFSTKTQGAPETPVIPSFLKQRPLSATTSHGASLVSKIHDSRLRPDTDNAARQVPQTDSIADSTRASAHAKKRKRSSPPSPPRKKQGSSRGKENQVSTSRGRTSRKVATSSKDKKRSQAGDVARERGADGGQSEASWSFAQQLGRLFSKRLNSE